MIRFRAPRWRADELARRLCQLLCGQDNIWQEGGGRWHIGSANDWWLYPQGDDRYALFYRYSGGLQVRMLALAKVMSWLLALEEVTIHGP